MPLGTLRQVGLACIAMAAALPAQEPGPPAPKFDVVSIHAVPFPKTPIMREQDFTPVLPGGQYIDMYSPLASMIGFAYDVKLGKRLMGLPDPMGRQAYSVAAKPAAGFPVLPPGQNREQVRLMMRAMLADRFHLRLHTETRQEPVYELEVAKGGIKIQEVDAPVPPAVEGHVGAAMGDRTGRIVGHKSTIAGIVVALNVFLDRPVVDRTGLTGYYEFDVHWRAVEAPGLSDTPSMGFGNEGAALLMTNLQDQFGLRLTKGIGPIVYWVVDHIEPPSEN